MPANRLHARCRPTTLAAWQRVRRLARAIADTTESRPPRAADLLGRAIAGAERDLRERASAAGLDVFAVLGERPAAPVRIPPRPVVTWIDPSRRFFPREF